jgi:transcriptional regulator with XRE-family HTH domain
MSVYTRISRVLQDVKRIGIQLEKTLKTFGDMLKAAREERGLSVRRLAELVSDGGIATTTGAMIAFIEKGKPCSYRLGLAIAIELNLDPQVSLELIFRGKFERYIEREREYLRADIRERKLRKLFDETRVFKDRF